MPDDFDSLYSAAKQPAQPAQVAQAPAGGDDFDSLYKQASGPAQTEAQPQLSGHAEIQQSQPINWNHVVEDAYRGPMAGIAKIDDLMDTVGRDLHKRMGIDQFDLPKSQETSLQEWQRNTGKPHYPLVYDMASALPVAAVAPELLPGVGGAVGFGANVVLPNMFAGGVLEAGEQAGQGKALDAAKIGEQAGIAGLAGSLLHPIFFGLRHPFKAAENIKGMFTKEAPEAAAAGGWEKVGEGHSLPEHIVPNEEAAAERAEQVRQGKIQQGYGEAEKAVKSRQAREQEMAKAEMLHEAAYQRFAKIKPANEEAIAGERSGEVLQGKAEYYEEAAGEFGGPQDYKRAYEHVTKDDPPPPGAGMLPPEAPPPSKGGGTGGGGTSGGGETPGKVPTVREEAVGLRSPHKPLTDLERKVITESWAPMLKAKAIQDQAEYNFREAFEALSKKLGAGNSIKKAKHQVLEPEQEEEIRKLALEWAGLKPDQLKRNPLTSEISTIRQADAKSMPLRPYKAKGNNLPALIGEVKFWSQSKNAAEAEYKQIRDSMRIGDVLQPHESVELMHGGRRWVVKHSVQPKREGAGPLKGLGIIPQGNAEQNKLYAEALRQMRAEAMAAKAAANQELVPHMDALASMLEETGDVELAKIVRGRKAIEADERVYEAAQKDGLGEAWKDMLKGLIEEESNLRKALGVGAIAGGQALGAQKAEAAGHDYEAQQNNDLQDVGTGLTLLGAAAIAGPKLARTPAGRKTLNVAAHVICTIPDHTIFPALRATIKAAQKLGIKQPGQFIWQATVTRANGDIIQAGAPEIAAKLAALKNEWAHAVGGKDLIPETPQAAQAWLEAPYMSREELAANPFLNPMQKQRLGELRALKDKGAAILKGAIEEIRKVDPDSKLADTMQIEMEMNWERGAARFRAGRKNLINLMARGAVDAAQRGNIKLHTYHLMEMIYSVPARAGTDNFAEAQRLLATADKTAKGFCRSFNLRPPIHGNYEDTAHRFTDKCAALWEQAINKIPGASSFSQSKVAKTTGQAISGQLTETIKLDTALLAFSEQAAQDMNYSSGKQLRADLTAWLNRDVRKASGEFSHARMLEATGRILAGLDQTVGGSPAGFKLALAIDRLSHNNPWWKTLAPFTRTRILAGRARASLGASVIDHLERGEFDKARQAAGAMMLMSGVSVMWLGGQAFDKEFQLWLLQNDPVTAKRYHDTINRFALLGRTPGAIGGALQHAGVKNELGKYNFRAPHTQPSLFWPGHVGEPIIVQAVKSVAVLGDDKAKPAAKTRAMVALAAQAGATGIPNLMSFAVMERIGQHAMNAEEDGGNIHYTFTPEAPFAAGEYIKDGHTFKIPGVVEYEKPHYVNSHMEENGPAESAMRNFLTPGESQEAEEHMFNDYVEYYCERNIKTKYGPDAHKQLKKVYDHMTPIAHWYSRVKNKMSRKTASPHEIERYENTKERYGNVEDEMQKPIQWGTVGVKPAEFWQYCLKTAQEHPDWIKSVGAQ
jgi:hypothetical protein